MDKEIPMMTGYLIVPTQSGFSLNRISKKKSSNQKFCLLFKASRHGLERLEICETREDKNPKIITLENCVKITTEQPPINLIRIITKTGTLTLNAITETDLKEWLSALQTVAFKDKSTTLLRNSVIEEDNDLYCSSYGDGVFQIRLIPSEASVRCHMDPRTYTLHLTAIDLQLRLIGENDAVVAKWPYRYIRKYGYRDGKFTFEAGRKCDTGEGVFSLDHINPQEVFRCMAARMKSMKKLMNNDSLDNFDCNEHQLSAAFSMEAGSRSPLPLSPNNQMNNSDFDLNQSCASIRGFLSSNDSLNNVSTASTSIQPNIKQIPTKPPRKTLEEVKTQKFRQLLSYEPVTIGTDAGNKTAVIIKTPPSTPENSSKSITLVIPNSSSDNVNNEQSPCNGKDNKEEQPPELPVRNESKKGEERDYESIETITDAWKTMGIDEVKHTERASTPEDDIVDFVWQRTQSQKEKRNNKTVSPATTPTGIPTTITIDDVSCEEDDDDEDNDGAYDKLQFFGPTRTLSSNNCYKTIVNVAPPTLKKQNSQPVTSNDYELIAAPSAEMQPCRLADDSYLGYGVLRKPHNIGLGNGPVTATANTVLLNDENGLLDHRQYNGLDYAIVSKPKRV